MGRTRKIRKSLFDIPIVVAIGSGGGRILDSLDTRSFKGYKIAVNNSIRDLCLLGSSVGTKLCVGVDQAGSGMDVEKGRSDFLKGADQFLKVFRRQCKIAAVVEPDIIPVIGTLGHGFASGALPELLRMLKTNYPDSVILAWAVTPFGFQGKDIRERAHGSLRKCREFSTTITPLSNQAASQKLSLSQSMSLSRLYASINGEITGILESLFSSFTTTEGVVESLDKNDLKRIWTGECALISRVLYPDASSINLQSLKDADNKLLVDVTYTGNAGNPEQPTATYIIDGPGEITVSQMEELSQGLTEFKADMSCFKPLIIQRRKKMTSFTLIRGRMRLNV